MQSTLVGAIFAILCRRSSVLVVSTDAAFHDSTHPSSISLTCKGFEASDEGDGRVVGRVVWFLRFAECDFNERSFHWQFVIWTEVDSDRSRFRNWQRHRINRRASRARLDEDWDGDGRRNDVRNRNGLKERS